MGSSLRLAVACVALVACGGGKHHDRDAPIRIAFGDCTSSPVPFVSGPRPSSLQADGTKTAARDDAARYHLVSSGFDDPSVYGALLGDEDGASGGLGLGGIKPGTPRTRALDAARHGSGGTRARRNPVPVDPQPDPDSIGQYIPPDSLLRTTIRRDIRRNLPKIQDCYEKQLRSKPALAGMVVVQFLISPSGSVASPSASGLDPAVASCVAEVIQGIEFPRPSSNSRMVNGVVVNDQFIFRPADEAGRPEVRETLPVLLPPPPPPAPPPYQPGAHDPLRQVELELAACLRGATFGAMISMLFDGRTDLEIIGDPDVVYGDVVKTIEIATRVGFTDWKVLPPAAAAALPHLP